MIRAHVSENQENWNLDLPKLCFSYNSSIHTTTGFSPFEIMFGRKLVIPIDLVYPSRAEITRENIVLSKKIMASEIQDATVDEDINPQDKIQILQNVELSEIELRIPEDIEIYR